MGTSDDTTTPTPASADRDGERDPGRDDDRGPGRVGADMDPRKAGRPGGPGQGGQQVVSPGSVGPAPVGDGGEQDQTVQDRREHLRGRKGS